MGRVLIIDDEPGIGWAIRGFLGDLGHQVALAATAEEGLQRVSDSRFDAVLLDVRLPGVDGLSILAELKQRVAPAPIIVITAFGDLDTAVRALGGGAFEYLVKPFDLAQVGSVLQRALEPTGPTGVESTAEDPIQESRPAAPALIGRSPAMQQLFKQIAMVAPTDVPVLITGESGTGKELVARAIHQHSPRRDRTLLPVNLAALNPGLIERELFGHVRGSFTGADQGGKGLIELAAGGSLLLDEIGEVPPAVQVKLLRAIEHREATPVGDARPRPIDVRFLAATHRSLDSQIAAGQFRHDLYFRLSVFPIHVPPLRDRREDIPELAGHFLRLLWPGETEPPPLRDDVIAELVARSWPGNVRELRNAIERAAILARGRPIRPEDLPPRTPGVPVSLEDGPNTARGDPEAGRAWAEAVLGTEPAECKAGGPMYDRLLEVVEPPLLQSALRHLQGHRARAAELLGIHRATLRQKLRKYGLD